VIPVAVTVEELRAYVKAKSADATFLTECLDTANALLSAKVLVEKVPASILANATKQVAGNIYARRASSLEHAQLGDGTDTSPFVFRPALDPLTPVWPMLAPWKKSVGIA